MSFYCIETTVTRDPYFPRHEYTRRSGMLLPAGLQVKYLREGSFNLNPDFGDPPPTSPLPSKRRKIYNNR